ncbi:MAG: hypothetical protein KDJ17_04060 [Hyphomicrobiaceae bacterium]|nr:hypothetical protein [Hyphomicrobiaceae bacterium]
MEQRSDQTSLSDHGGGVALASLHARPQAAEEPAWRGFIAAFATSFAALLIATAAFIALTNPFGNLPRSVFSKHAIADGNQRFQYPSVARDGQFESVLVGTSTSGILNPRALDAAFGGRFANLAMDSARAWEQAQVARFFNSQRIGRATLIIGLDTVWCDEQADQVRTTERGFPLWMYDDALLNDLPHMLNWKAVDIGIKRLGIALGVKSPRIGADGYKPFLPDEEKYDLAKVRKSLGHWSPADYLDPAAPTVGAAQLPSLAWLDDILSLQWRRAALVFMPVHITAQPTSRSARASVEQQCKARITEIARQHNVALIDFRIPSNLTMNDENYWDHLHYRVPVGERLVKAIAQALATGQNDPDGTWRALVLPSPNPWR